MKRRTVLQASALAAVQAASGQTPAPKKARITSSVMLWTLKGTFEERVQIAARAGMQSVEMVAEHIKWTDGELAKQKQFVRSFGMGIDTIIATPDWKNRPVSMVDPKQRDNFLADVKQAITFAQKLEVPQIILMSGDTIPGRSHSEQWASLVEGSKRAGELAAKAGNVTLIVEPLNNKVNHKGFFLTTCVDGLKLMREVDNPHVKLLFDIYHEQVQTGDVIRTLTEAMPYVTVFHVADNPGRNDPGTGELNYGAIYKAIQKGGYGGYICMEYIPLADAAQSLKKSVDEMRAAVA